MMKKPLQLSLLAFLLILSACSGTGSGSGLVAIQIENARAPAGVDLSTSSNGKTTGGTQSLNFNSLSTLDILQVTEFKVTVSGDGMDEPMITTAPGSATQIEVLEIPAGVNRSILVEAFNGQGQAIRRRQIDGVTIDAGVIAQIKMSLNTIPLILNMQDGAVVLAQNFRILGFGEPATSIRIDAESESDAINLNQSLSEGSLISPSRETALFEAQPTSFLLGKQTITVTDENSKESSSVTVFVLDGASRPGTKLVTASDNDPLQTVGTGISNERLGNFPAVIHALSEAQGGNGQ